jgi:sensor histidine kinase YesM
MKIWKQQLAIWLAYSISLYSFFEYLTDTITAIVHVASFVGTQLIAYYSNTRIVLPHFFEQKRFGLYVLLNMILLIFGSIVTTISEQFTPEALTNINGDSALIHYESPFALEPLIAHAMPSFIAIFIAFVIFQHRKKAIRDQRDLALIKAEKNFLVQQLNPHFLFNTLNNIYSLTSSNNPKGAAAVMTLSKLLDYSLYGTKKEFVPIAKEIQAIENFINLFKLKDDSIQRIYLEVNKVDRNFSVAPLLMLPIVENALKHGDLEQTSTGYVAITITSDEKHLYFTCENSYALPKKVDQTGGIGIKNIQRRLAIIYPGKHAFKITSASNKFSVSLTIDTYGA